MIKTYHYGLLLLPFCFLTGGLVSVAQAQSSQATEAQTAAETIDAKMTEQSNRIQALQDIVNERQTLPDIGKLLRQLPVNNETIADKTKALSAQNIATEQITAAVQLSNQISQAIE